MAKRERSLRIRKYMYTAAVRLNSTQKYVYIFPPSLPPNPPFAYSSRPFAEKSEEREGRRGYGDDLKSFTRPRSEREKGRKGTQARKTQQLAAAATRAELLNSPV